MSAYLVYSYTVTNPEEYQTYPPAAMPTLAGHDVEVLVADYESEAKDRVTDGKLTEKLSYVNG